MVARIPNDFFKIWTPEMAYVLGYWWADGHILKTAAGKRVGFTSKDGSHLEQIAQVIGVGRVAPIIVGKQTYYQLMLKRSDMFDDLINLGGAPRKSLTTNWPTIPSDWLRHFVRGFIDGDGCLYWQKPNANRFPYIPAIGTEAFLKGMTLTIEQVTGIPAPNCHPSENIYKLCWSGLRAKCLAGWLYEHCELYLERKRSIALEFFQWQPPSIIRRKTITLKMREQFAHLLPE